jgi:hypothetical protein
MGLIQDIKEFVAKRSRWGQIVGGYTCVSTLRLYLYLSYKANQFLPLDYESVLVWLAIYILCAVKYTPPQQSTVSIQGSTTSSSAGSTTVIKPL